MGSRSSIYIIQGVSEIVSLESSGLGDDDTHSSVKQHMYHCNNMMLTQAGEKMKSRNEYETAYSHPTEWKPNKQHRRSRSLTR